MKHEVSTLEGPLLNAAVELALGAKRLGPIGVNHPTEDGTPWCLSGCNDWWQDTEGHRICGPCSGWPRQYSSDWAVGGPLIERERMKVSFAGDEAKCPWIAATPLTAVSWGPTCLVAAMRAFVTSRCGEEVDLP